MCKITLKFTVEKVVCNERIPEMVYFQYNVTLMFFSIKTIYGTMGSFFTFIINRNTDISISYFYRKTNIQQDSVEIFWCWYSIYSSFFIRDIFISSYKYKGYLGLRDALLLFRFLRWNINRQLSNMRNSFSAINELLMILMSFKLKKVG